MAKKNLMVYIEEEVIEKAKELGLNISKVCENCLKDMIGRIEGSNPPKDCEKDSDKELLVGPPGFEPGSREPKSQSLDHASRRPRLKAKEALMGNSNQ